MTTLLHIKGVSWNDWLIAYRFCTVLRKFHKQRDICIVGEELRNLKLCSVIPALEQGRMFVVPYLLRHRPLIYTVSSEGPSRSLITSQRNMRTYPNQDTYEKVRKKDSSIRIQKRNIGFHIPFKLFKTFWILFLNAKHTMYLKHTSYCYYVQFAHIPRMKFSILRCTWKSWKNVEIYKWNFDEWIMLDPLKRYKNT